MWTTNFASANKSINSIKRNKARMKTATKPLNT